MYVRRSVRKRKDGSQVAYLQLCHNEWDAERGRSVTKVVHNFGREEQVDTDAVRRLIASLRRLLSPAEQLADAAGEVGAELGEQLRWRASVALGGAWALDGLWRQLGIDTLLAGLLKGGAGDLRAGRQPGVGPDEQARRRDPLGRPQGRHPRAGADQRRRVLPGDGLAVGGRGRPR
jgi:hypothetical protein